MAFCSQCGTEIPADARFCPGCGKSVDGTSPSAAGEGVRPAAPIAPAPSGSPMPWVLPALVLVALAAIAYLLLAPRSGERTASGAEVAAPGSATGREAIADRPPPAVTDTGTYTSAAVMDSAFSSNPAAAAVRYAGPVRVSGIIATMVQPGSTPSLSMEGRTRFNYVIVNFPAGYRERLVPLSKGQSITVACDNARGLAGTTILSGCLLV